MLARDKREKEVERLWKKKAWHRLLTRLEQWLVDDPDWRDVVLWKLGWARLHLHGHSSKVKDQAAKELREALKENPALSSVVDFDMATISGDDHVQTDLEAYLLLHRARVAARAGRLKVALKHAQAAVDKAPDCIELQYNLAKYARSAEDFEKSVAVYSEIIKQRPENGPYYQRILARQNLGDYEGVLEDVDRMLCLRPEEEASWRVTRAETLLELERLDDAHADIVRVLTQGSKNVKALLCLGYIHRARGNATLMREVWAQAVDIGCPGAEWALGEFE